MVFREYKRNFEKFTVKRTFKFDTLNPSPEPTYNEILCAFKGLMEEL